MNFEYKYYKIELLWGSLLGLLLVVVLMYILSRGIYRQIKFQKGKWYFWLVVVLTTVIGGLIVFDCALNLKYGIHLISENENDLVQTSGVIEDIIIQYHISGHTEEEGRTNCKLIVINGEEYLVVSVGDLKTGDIVTLNYLPKSRIVLEWQIDMA